MIDTSILLSYADALLHHNTTVCPDAALPADLRTAVHRSNARAGISPIITSSGFCQGSQVSDMFAALSQPPVRATLLLPATNDATGNATGNSSDTNTSNCSNCATISVVRCVARAPRKIIY